MPVGAATPDRSVTVAPAIQRATGAAPIRGVTGAATVPSRIRRAVRIVHIVRHRGGGGIRIRTD